MYSQLTAVSVIIFVLTFITTEAAECGPGTFKQGQLCKKCPPGTYQPYANVRKCRACPVNTFSSESGVVDRTLCQPCPLNSFSKPASTKCAQCPGKHVRVSLSGTKCRACRGDECKPCPANHVRFPAGCKPRPSCPKGFIPPPPGASYFPDNVCVSPVTGCPKSLRLFGWFRRAVCMKPSGTVVCPPDHVFDGVDRCLSCSTGMKIVKSSGLRLQCSVCDAYSVSTGGISRMCTKCPKNLYKSLDGAKCLTLQQFINSLKAA